MFETPGQVIAILQVEIGVLESFLMGKAIYRQVRVKFEGKVSQHLMSLGDFLDHQAVWRTCIALQICSPHQLDRNLIKESESLFRTFENRAKALAVREAKSRLESLSWNLESWIKEGHLSPGLFATEMAQRSRIQRLKDVCELNDLNGALDEADSQIRSMTKDGEFIWRQDYSGAYPSDSYWFLYRNVT